MKNRKRLGLEIEKQVANYLENKGFKILEKNFFSRFGEIDIVALDNNTLVFVEVRSKKSSNFGHPLESITRTKRERLIKTAMYYLQIKNINSLEMRFDIVSVYKGNIDHIKNAFYLD